MVVIIGAISELERNLIIERVLRCNWISLADNRSTSTPSAAKTLSHKGSRNHHRKLNKQGAEIVVLTCLKNSGL